MSLTDRIRSSTFVAQHSGHYLICFSLIDEITHLLPTLPRKCKQKCKKNDHQPHPFPKPNVKCMAVIHHKVDMAQLHLRGPASLLITEYAFSVSHRVLHTTMILTRCKHAASGRTHAIKQLVSFSLFFCSLAFCIKATPVFV